MYDQARPIFQGLLDEIRAAGLWKHERVLQSPQAAVIQVAGRSLLNFCSNNYLGLASDPRIVQAARQGLEDRGFGLSSVRFICGTQDHHLALERRIADYLRMEDAILYSSCFDANGGLFETLLGADDAIISDSLNHASIIDGIRLCKARRFLVPHGDLAALEHDLVQARGSRLRLIATDGVFSMDGHIANLPAICELARKHEALVMVDDSHATGLIGEGGRGTPTLLNCSAGVDIITSTFGKALGGASGGFIAARSEIVSLLRQRSRPYLFSNSLAPAIVAATLKAIELAEQGDDLRARLSSNTQRFRSAMRELGFDVRQGQHPIVPVMLGEAERATALASRLGELGVYVVGFSFPVVPKGQARVRVQLSAAHEPGHIEQAIDAFARAGRELGIIR